MFQESQQMEPMLEEAFGKAHEVLIPVIPARPKEKTVFQAFDSSLIHAICECFSRVF